MFSWGFLWKVHFQKKKKVFIGTREGRRVNDFHHSCLFLWWSSFQPCSPPQLTCSRALLKAIGSCFWEELEAWSLWMQYLFVFLKALTFWQCSKLKDTQQFSCLLKQLLGRLVGVRRWMKVGSVLSLPWAWGLSPSGLAYLKDLEKQKSTGSVMSVSFQPTHIQLCPKPMLEWRWLGSCCWWKWFQTNFYEKNNRELSNQGGSGWQKRC